MVDQLSLFPPPDPEQPRQSLPAGAASASQDLQELARALPRNLYLGTSSWFFPGWHGLLWDRVADETMLARNGLPAYASHPLFNTVCIDRAFYAPLDRNDYREYASQVPDGFRFIVKAPSAKRASRLSTAWLKKMPRLASRSHASSLHRLLPANKLSSLRIIKPRAARRSPWRSWPPRFSVASRSIAEGADSATL